LRFAHPGGVESTAPTPFEDPLQSIGRTNFSENCEVGGAPARLAMTDRRVYLGIAGDPGALLGDEFDNVLLSGTGATRTATFEGKPVEITFADERAAQRFARVLDVRQHATLLAASESGTPDLGTSPPNPDVAPRTASRRRMALLAGGALVLVIVIAGAVKAASKSNNNSVAQPDVGVSSDSPVATGPTYTAHSACAVEVNVGLDIALNTNFNFTNLSQAVGFQNPQFALYGQMVSPFVQLQNQGGSAGAEANIAPQISVACTQAGDPALTQGQVASLTQLSTGTDTAALQAVDYFAPG
jgi:hypothetical protein